jgi:hypothetical protein
LKYNSRGSLNIEEARNVAINQIVGDMQTTNNGYIVVSTSKNESPIVEYSYQGKSFIDTAKSTTHLDAENHHPGKKS